MTPIKKEIKRNPDGTLMKGSGTLNPSGRPPGKTLKEFAREMLMTMTDEQKVEYLKKLPPEIVWRMAEGNPHNTQETKADVEVKGLPILSNVLHSNNSNPESDRVK